MPPIDNKMKTTAEQTFQKFSRSSPNRYWRLVSFFLNMRLDLDVRGKKITPISNDFYKSILLINIDLIVVVFLIVDFNKIQTKRIEIIKTSDIYIF